MEKQPQKPQIDKAPDKPLVPVTKEDRATISPTRLAVPNQPDGLKPYSDDPTKTGKQGDWQKPNTGSEEATQHTKETEIAASKPGVSHRSSAEGPEGTAPKQFTASRPSAPVTGSTQKDAVAWIPSDTISLFVTAVQKNHDAVRAYLKSVLHH